MRPGGETRKILATAQCHFYRQVHAEPQITADAYVLDHVQPKLFAVITR